MGNHQGRPLHPLDDLGHGIGFAGSGSPQQDLQPHPLFHILDKSVNSPGLVSPGLKIRYQFKLVFHPVSSLPL